MTEMTDLKAKIEAHIRQWVKGGYNCGCSDVGCRGRHEERDIVLESIEEHLLPEVLALFADHAAEPAPVAVDGAPYEFERYVGGVLMAEGVCIERQGNLTDAMRAASKLASKGPKGEVPVLVYRPRADLAPTGNTAMVEALTLAANRLALLTVEQDTGSEAFYRVGEWADEARAALQPAAPQPTPEVEAWRDIEAAPYETEVTVQAGRMTFPAILRWNVSTDSDGNDVDQWQAAEEGQHPPCWSGGSCWETNEEGSPSLQPTAWMPALARGSVADKGEWNDG